MLPFSDVCVLEDGSSRGLRGARMVGDDFLGFGAEGEVGEDDVAAFTQEGFGECEVNS